MRITPGVFLPPLVDEVEEIQLLRRERILHFLCFLVFSADQWFFKLGLEEAEGLLLLFKESTLTFSSFTF